jgi:hypothetical protein
MTRPDPTRLLWKKSTLSGSTANCVEIAQAASSVLVRDSKDPSGAILSFSASSWGSFIRGIRSAEVNR